MFLLQFVVWKAAKIISQADETNRNKLFFKIKEPNGLTPKFDILGFAQYSWHFMAFKEIFISEFVGHNLFKKDQLWKCLFQKRILRIKLIYKLFIISYSV